MSVARSRVNEKYSIEYIRQLNKSICTIRLTYQTGPNDYGDIIFSNVLDHDNVLKLRSNKIDIALNKNASVDLFQELVEELVNSYESIIFITTDFPKQLMEIINNALKDKQINNFLVLFSKKNIREGSFKIFYDAPDKIKTIGFAMRQSPSDEDCLNLLNEEFKQLVISLGNKPNINHVILDNSLLAGYYYPEAINISHNKLNSSNVVSEVVSNMLSIPTVNMKFPTSPPSLKSQILSRYCENASIDEVLANQGLYQEKINSNRLSR